MMRFLFFMICFGVTSLISAQSAVTVYNTTNSLLPDDLVTVIYIDAHENKWIGTQNGLVKINAAGEWTIFNTDNSGLPDNTIHSIFTGADDRLYAGTFLGGLAVYDGSEWMVYDPLNSGMPDYDVRSIKIGAGDTVWIGTTAGLTKWDGADYWFTYTQENSGLKSNNIRSIYVAGDTLFLGTINGGLSTYLNGVIDYYRTENSGIGDNTVLAIDADAYGNKWLALAFGGLSIYTAGGSFLNFTPITSDITEYSIDDVVVDNTGLGILGMSTTGLNIFDNTNWINYNTANTDLPEDSCHVVAVDADNRIWIGTETSGFVVFDRSLLEGIKSEKEVSFMLYPDPANNYIMLNDNFSRAEYSISDMSGQEIIRQELNSSSTSIDITNLAPGYYFVSVIDDDRISVKKFCIMR